MRVAPCWGPGSRQDSLGKGLRLQSTGRPTGLRSGNGETKAEGWGRCFITSFTFITSSPNENPAPTWPEAAGPAGSRRRGRAEPPERRSPPGPGAAAPSPTAAGSRERGRGTAGARCLRLHPILRPALSGLWTLSPGPGPAAPPSGQSPPRHPRGNGGPVGGADASFGVPVAGERPSPPLPGHRSESPLSLARAHGAPSPGGAGSSRGGDTGSGTGGSTGSGELRGRAVLRAPALPAAPARTRIPRGSSHGGRWPSPAPPTASPGPEGNAGHPWMGAPLVPGHTCIGAPRGASSGGHAGPGPPGGHLWVSTSGLAPLDKQH